MNRAVVLVVIALATVSALACLIVQRNGWTLYYGDAEAHLNIARRIVDSRTPGYAQVGAVWLPLPHLIMALFVHNDTLWRTGLAGTIPSAACFITGGAFLFAAARRAFHSTAAAAISTGVYALNPNLLYLQAIPMTEAMLFASVLAVLYFTILFRDTKSNAAAAGAGLATFAAALTRYEGWFLIPFVTLYFFVAAPKAKFRAAAIYGAIASLGPLLWIAHNVWWFGDPLDFYHGPYSPKAIQGAADYPGNANWRLAIEYFLSAARQASGWAAVALGIIGTAVALFKRIWWPIAFLMLPPLFYIWSMHSSAATPIFVPNLPPYGYYNTRYGVGVLLLLAFSSGAIIFLVPKNSRVLASICAIVIAAGFWALRPSADNWICWKESQVNSEARRGWTWQAAGFLAAHYRSGGIFTSPGDVMDIYREAGIHFRDTLYDGNEPAWMNAAAEPDYFLRERWAVAQSGDPISSAMTRAGKFGATYRLVKKIDVKGARPLEIYRRCVHENTIH